MTIAGSQARAVLLDQSPARSTPRQMSDDACAGHQLLRLHPPEMFRFVFWESMHGARTSCRWRGPIRLTKNVRGRAISNCRDSNREDDWICASDCLADGIN